MNRIIFKNVIRQSIRHINTGKTFKVTICGASGSVNESLIMLVKTNPLISELCICDQTNPYGIISDLVAIPSNVNVSAHKKLSRAIKDADLVVISTGVQKRRRMSYRDLFIANASHVREISEIVGRFNPGALVAILTNPINSLVPLVNNILKKYSGTNPMRIMGITTLDTLRANTIIGKLEGIDPRNIEVPVVGGHSPETTVPLFSQIKHQVPISEEQIKWFTNLVKYADSNIIDAKRGESPATLSRAFGAARFIDSLLRAMSGEPNIIEPAFIRTNVLNTKYSSQPILLGPGGVMKHIDIGNVSLFELQMLEKATRHLWEDIKIGEDFLDIKLYKPSPCCVYHGDIKTRSTIKNCSEL